MITFTSASVAAYTLGASVGADTITLDNSNSGGKINITADVPTSQTINSNVILGTTAGANSSYQFNNASTGGAVLILAGNVTGGTGGTAGAKVLTLPGVGAGIISGVISNGGATTLTLSNNANSFTGGTITQNTIVYTRAMQISGPATLIVGADHAIGNGVINITGGSIPTFQAGGGDRALAQSIVLSNSSAFNVTGVNSLSTSGKIVLGGAATITNNIVGAGKTFTVGDNIEIRNDTTGSRTVTFAGSGTTVLNGPVVNYNPLLTSNAVGSLAYTGSGTLKSTGVNTYSGTTTVGAGGIYLVNGSHSVATVGSYTVNGTLGGTGVITPSGVNSVTIGAFTGSLAPGDSTLATASQTGALNIGNSLSFGTGSAFNVQLGGASPGNGQGFYDQVNMTNVAGSITLNTGVLLNLSLVNSFTPAPDNIFYILNREDFGDFFTLFDGTSEGGTVLIGGCTAQITYQANWTGNQGTSSLTGGNDVAIYNFVIPEPRSVFLVSAGFGFMLCFRRRLKY